MRDRLPTHCARCHGTLRAWITSKFNLDELCLECKDDEKLAPGYKAADDAEVASVRRGDYNFPGVGLSPEDHAFLKARRQARDKQAIADANARANPETP